MKKKKKKKKYWIYGILVLFFLLYIFVFDESSFIQRWRVSRINNQLKEEIIRLETENERLVKENEALRTDKKSLEKRAREFGLQKEDEEVFLFIEEDEVIKN